MPRYYHSLSRDRYSVALMLRTYDGDASLIVGWLGDVQGGEPNDELASFAHQLTLLARRKGLRYLDRARDQIVFAPGWVAQGSTLYRYALWGQSVALAFSGTPQTGAPEQAAAIEQARTWIRDVLRELRLLDAEPT